MASCWQTPAKMPIKDVRFICDDIDKLLLSLLEIQTYRAGSCTSELPLKVNCRIKFGLVCQLLAEAAQILSYNSRSVYNSLSAAIHLYMIWAYAVV